MEDLLTNERVSVSYWEGSQEWEEQRERWHKERDADETQNEAAKAVYWGRRRRGGLRLVHWCVTSVACWIEELCPADFNPNSLGN